MGLMGAVGAGLSEAGGAAAQIGLEQVKSAIEEDRAARLAELQSQIKMRDEQTIRGRNVADAATERSRVETEASAIAGQRKVTPPDVAAQTEASAVALEKAYEAGTLPDSIKQQGLIGLSKYATDAAVPDTKVTARDRLQAQGEHKELAKLEQRDNEHAASMDDKLADNTRLDTALSETMRHNKVLEDHAAADKLTPAARANLEMASTYVTSAHKAEAEAAKALDAARKDVMSTPEKIAQLTSDYQQSKAVVVSALAQYNKIGAAHFPDQWKSIEPDVASKPDPDISKIPKAASADLMAGKGTDAQFDKIFGAGAAAKVRAATPAATPVTDKPAVTPAADDSDIQKIDAEIAVIRTSLNTDATRRNNPLKGGSNVLSADDISRLESRLSELKVRRQKIGGLPITDATRGIINAVRN